MRDLQTEVELFQQQLKQHALPNFTSESKNLNADGGMLDTFSRLRRHGRAMLASAETNDEILYDVHKEKYIDLFVQANETMAKDAFREILDYYLDSGVEETDARQQAVESLWAEDERYQRWLPVRLEMHGKSQPLDLVGSPRHAIKGRPYVTAKEVQYLMAHPKIDPWEYVRSRHEKANSFTGTN